MPHATTNADTKRDTVVGVYPTIGLAKAAIRELKAGGFPTHQISLVARSLQDEEELHAFVNQGDRTEREAAAGAGVGGLLGALAGAAFLWVPGFGPLVFLGSLAMGLTGAAVGGLVGAMSGWGIPDDHVERYERSVRHNNLLVIAHGNPAEAARAKVILEATEADELRLHASTSADDPHIAPTRS